MAEIFQYIKDNFLDLIIRFSPIVVSIISLIISFIAKHYAKINSNYLTLDNQYKDLLNSGILRPILRDPVFTCSYQKHKENDSSNYYSYVSYAYMIWNYLETVYDFAIRGKNKYLRDVWTPVLIEENKIHYKWFRDNRFLFREEFQKYVDEQLNELITDEGSLKDFDKIYPHFEKEFPEDERKTRSQIIHLLVKGVYKLALLRFKNRQDNDDSFLGYALYHTNNKKTMIFLDYLHILDEYQCCGYGSKFLSLLDEKLSRPHNRGIFFEIEPIVDDKTARRNAFYQKNGAYKFDINYYLPTAKDCIELNLMVIPSSNVNYIPKDEIRDFIKEAISLIHNDFTHTSKVIDKYIDTIPSFTTKNIDDVILEKGDKEQLKVFAYKLKNSFSKDLVLDVEHLSKLIEDGKYKLYVVFSNTSNMRDIIGFTCVYESDDKSFAFLDYLYISEIVQGQGYGSKVIDKLQYIYKEYKYGLICEVPIPNDNQIDYYDKFVRKTAGQFLNCKYQFPSDDKRLQLRLVIYPNEGIDYISKDVISKFLNEVLRYIHFDCKNIDKILEYNARNMKDFHNELYK